MLLFIYVCAKEKESGYLMHVPSLELQVGVVGESGLKLQVGVGKESGLKFAAMRVVPLRFRSISLQGRSQFRFKCVQSCSSVLRFRSCQLCSIAVRRVGVIICLKLQAMRVVLRSISLRGGSQFQMFAVMFFIVASFEVVSCATS